jgi:hypothetical protein
MATFKSREEINKVFSEHIESLELSGLPFDAKAIGVEWSQALEFFENQQRVLKGLPPLD